MVALLVLASLLMAAGSPSARPQTPEGDGTEWLKEEADHSAEKQKAQPTAKSMNDWGSRWKRVRELQPKIADAAAPPKERLAAAQEYAGIKDWAKQQVEKNPDSWIDQMAGSDFFLQDGDYEKAAACADRAVEMGSPDGDPRLTARVLVVRGTANFQKGNIQAAYQDAQAAVEMDPTFTPGIELLKYTEGRANRKEEGIAATAGDQGSRLVASLSPTVPHTVNEYVDRHIEVPTIASEAAIKALKERTAGNWAAAKALADQALAHDPGDPMAHAVKGFALNDAKDYNGAIIETSQAIAKGWNDPTLFSVRAQALEKAGQLKAALEDADLAARLEPNNANHLYARGVIQMQLDVKEGRIDGRFLEDLKRAATLDPGKFGEFYENNLRQFENYKAKAEGQMGSAGKELAGQKSEQLRGWSASELAEWTNNEKTTTGKMKNGIKAARKKAATSPELVAFAGGVGVLVAGAAAFLMSRSNEQPPPPPGRVEMIFENPRRRDDHVVIRPIRKPGDPPVI